MVASNFETASKTQFFFAFLCSVEKWSQKAVKDGEKERICTTSSERKKRTKELPKNKGSSFATQQSISERLVDELKETPKSYNTHILCLVMITKDCYCNLDN